MHILFRIKLYLLKKRLYSLRRADFFEGGPFWLWELDFFLFFYHKCCINHYVLKLISIRVSEPEPGASYKNRRLRNPETPFRYIIARVNESIYFFITLGTWLKSLGLYSRSYYILSFGSREPRSQLKNINGSKTLIFIIT